MYELGKLYQGICGPDPNTAFIWFRIGERFGSAESQYEANKLSSQLTQVMARKAEAAVVHWISQHSGAQKEEDED